MIRLLDALCRRLGYVRAPRRPTLTPPSDAGLPVVRARLVAADPAMQDVMARTIQITRAVRALQAQAAVAETEGQAERGAP